MLTGALYLLLGICHLGTETSLVSVLYQLLFGLVPFMDNSTGIQGEVQRSWPQLLAEAAGC